MNLVHDERFDKLRLRDWSDHFDHRLVGEHRSALRNGIHVTGKPERAERRQELIGESIERAEVGDIIVGEVQVFEMGEQLLETTGEQEVPVWRQPPNKQREGGRVGQPLDQIRLHHGELVQNP